MAGIIDVFVQLAPIISFFVLLVILLLMFYFIGLMGDAYRRSGQVSSEVHAVLVTLFGEDLLTQMRAAEKDLSPLTSQVQQVRLRAQKVVAGMQKPEDK